MVLGCKISTPLRLCTNVCSPCFAFGPFVSTPHPTDICSPLRHSEKAAKQKEKPKTVFKPRLKSCSWLDYTALWKNFDLHKSVISSKGIVGTNNFDRLD